MDTFTLRIDGGTQPRERLDEATVERYAEAMAAGLWDFGRLFDPAVAFYDGTEHWLSDGFRRLEAAKRAGKLDEFSACLEVRQGTVRDAILYSVGANAHHGFRCSDDDKRRVVSRLLDPEWSKWSDREIARRCYVTHPFVGKLRQLEPFPVNEPIRPSTARSRRWTRARSARRSRPPRRPNGRCRKTPAAVCARLPGPAGYCCPMPAQPTPRPSRSTSRPSNLRTSSRPRPSASLLPSLSASCASTPAFPDALSPRPTKLIEP